MPTKDYVVQEGALFQVSQVQERIELKQVQDEVTSKQSEYDQSVEDLGNGEANAETLLALAQTRDERKAALEDSKSDLERASSVVAQSPLATTGEDSNDTESQTVDIPVAVQATEL